MLRILHWKEVDSIFSDLKLSNFCHHTLQTYDGLILGSLLGVNMSFMKFGLILLIVLKISIAIVHNLLIFIVVVLFFCNKVA